MKGFILCLALLCSAFSLSAQSSLETVHLKNGSIIKGVIIEQIPNQSLKIQTQDGNIFVFQLDEVTKITKEPLKLSRSLNSQAKERGYRGFVDFGYSIGVGDYDINRIEISTSHGFQFNRYFYLGGGAALNYYYDGEIASVPVFVNPRLTIPTNGRVSPFFDLRTGYTFGDDIEGLYFSSSVGARLSLKNKNAMNFSIGYTVQNIDAYGSYDYGYGGYYYSDNFVNFGAIILKVGIEF